MIPRPLNEIADADIVRLRDAGVQEGKTIEYKKELPGTRDEDKREFLADISSFANTEGGDIIYGVAENQGVIADIVGLVVSDFDLEMARLEGLIRDGISPRIISNLRAVPVASGKVLVIRIEKSWMGPHRVVFRGHDKFYGRTSAGKFPMDVGQLRTAFLQAGTLAEKISGFRVDRIIDIANDRAPVPLVQEPTLVLHIVPLGVLSGESQFDVTILSGNPVLHRLWNSNGWYTRMTFDGMIIQTPENGEGRVSSYAHFFRNGILEAVNTSLLETHQVPGMRLIPHGLFEGALLAYLPSCFQSLQNIGVHPPVSVSLTLIGVRGLRMAMGAFALDTGREIREETLIIPGAIVEDFSVPAASVLKPMFDRVWNACGLLKSQNFDEQGNWRR